jgi:hypothetical protein
VRLCADTAAALYKGFTRLDPVYQAGTRPQLEKIVAELTTPAMNEREKMLALLAFVRDLPEQPLQILENFSGGTEEEVIGRSSGYCGEQARLLVCLAQIAGLPARLVGHFASFNPDGSILKIGHGVTEIYLEGHWAYVDIRGVVVERPDGKLASAYDIMMFPEMLKEQPEWVHALIREGYSFERVALRFLSPRNVTVIANYYIEEAAKYDYQRIYRDPDFKEKHQARGRQKAQEYQQKFLKLF